MSDVIQNVELNVVLQTAVKMKVACFNVIINYASTLLVKEIPGVQLNANLMHVAIVAHQMHIPAKTNA